MEPCPRNSLKRLRINCLNDMEFLAFAIVVLAIPTLGVAYLVKKTHDKDLNEWNKENKKKFETYHELKAHLRKKEFDQHRSEKEKIIKAKLGGWYYKEREREAAKERARFKKELESKIKEEDKIKELEDKIKRAPKKESFAKTTFSGGGLTSKIARLKKLYKNGTLTKAEFEKAKNKLLK